MSESTIFNGYGSVTDKAMKRLLSDHYQKRKPPMCETFEWWKNDNVVGVLTFGVPASRHMQIGAYPENPDLVIELNRLWLEDELPHGTASWFLSRCLKTMSAHIVLSYADTAAGHSGGVYKAANFHYSGWTDMDRKTPRFDYLVPGKHTRSAFRDGLGVNSKKVRRKPKAKFWTVTGSRKEKRYLETVCKWPKLCWQKHPTPTEHAQFVETS